MAITLLMLGLATSPAEAAAETWSDVAAEMSGVLDQAFESYRGGDAEAGKDWVDEAYYGYYEKLGFEKTVMAHISGSRAADAEYEFGLIKKAMLGPAPESEVLGHIDRLKTILVEDARTLDGQQGNPLATFVGSLIIILREGFEAILVVGAIVASLIKSGAKDKTRAVYLGALVAIGASIVLAIALNALTALAGANQEIIEGVTILIAVPMLVYVSNWIASKSDGQAWAAYIKGKTDASLGRGGVFALALVAFLAVFREGAETILFYQALQAQDSGGPMIWLGLAVGVVLLTVVYLLIRFLSIRLPMRPFFLGTGVILALMAFVFTGSGIKELQEGGVLPITPVAGFPSIDLLGIYPSAETLVGQALVLVLMASLFAVAFHRQSRPHPTPAPLTSPPEPSTEEPSLEESLEKAS
jgi:high-affinity iron transporter